MRQATNKVEDSAIWLYQHITSFRLVFGLIVGIGLTYISTRFNISFANIIANSAEAKDLLPKGYALLNIVGVFLVIMLAVGIANDFLRWCSYGMVALVLSMSLFTGLSFQLANDAVIGQQQNEQAITRENTIFAATSALTQKGIASHAGTVKNKTKFEGQLKDSIRIMQNQSDRISAIQRGSSPPALVVFTIGERLTGIKAATIMTFMRALWSLAIEIAPLLCLAIVGAEIKRILGAKGQGQDLNVASNDGPATDLGNIEEGQTNVFELRADNSAVDTVKKQIQKGEMKKISKARLKAKGYGDTTALFILSDLRRQDTIERHGNGHRIKLHIQEKWAA